MEGEISLSLVAGQQAQARSQGEFFKSLFNHLFVNLPNGFYTLHFNVLVGVRMTYDGDGDILSKGGIGLGRIWLEHA